MDRFAPRNPAAETLPRRASSQPEPASENTRFREYPLPKAAKPHRKNPSPQKLKFPEANNWTQGTHDHRPGR